MHKRRALYEKIIVFIPVFAICFTVIASAAGVGVIITKQALKLFVPGDADQSIETAVNGNDNGKDDQSLSPSEGRDSSTSTESPSSGSHGENSARPPSSSTSVGDQSSRDGTRNSGQTEETGNEGKQPNNSSGVDNSANPLEVPGDDDNENNVEPSDSNQNNSGNNSDLPPSGSDTDYEALIKPSIVTAMVIKDVKVKSSYTGRTKTVGNASAGEKVVIIKGHGCEWYNIETEKGETGWVPADALNIPPDPETNPNRLAVQQLEGFVKYKGLSSSTEYLVWVDIDRQLVNVFKRSGDVWKLERSMPCSTGKNISPTLRGTYKIQDRGTWFYNESLKSGAKYWVRYSGSYLFHSVAMNKKQEVVDPTIGERASSGCIRLSVEDSRWFYDNIPRNTTVFVY